jgi:hypothetical protein
MQEIPRRPNFMLERKKLIHNVMCWKVVQEHSQMYWNKPRIKMVICGPGRIRILSLDGANDQTILWARQDSNLRPSDYESPALTAAPRALKAISD